MNSAKIFATIVTAIALFPAASWADNVSGNTQSLLSILLRLAMVMSMLLKPNKKLLMSKSLVTSVPTLVALINISLAPQLPSVITTLISKMLCKKRLQFKKLNNLDHP